MCLILFNTGFKNDFILFFWGGGVHLKLKCTIMNTADRKVLHTSTAFMLSNH